MSLRRLKNITKKRFLLRDVFKTSRAYIKKMTFSWRPGRLLNVLCPFNLRPVATGKVITISDKIDVGPLETLKKWKVFWGKQCIDINQVCHEYQWADICVRFVASQRSSKPNSRCIIYYLKWFFLFDETICNPLLLWTALTYGNLGEVR